MAEGDTILRAARRIEAALAGQALAVRAGNTRGRAAGVEQLDGRRLDRAEGRGKHLLLRFGDRTLHSHLGMSGSWQVGNRGARWRKPAAAAWVVLAGAEAEAVQFGGPTLRLLSTARLRRDPVLAHLGPDILAPDLDLTAAVASLSTGPGVGNIFKSEACFAARTNPWRQVAVYGRAGRRCPICRTTIAARGQGDANRRTYWCPRCQC